MNKVSIDNKGGWLKRITGTGAAIGTAIVMLSTPVEAGLGTGSQGARQYNTHRQPFSPSSSKQRYISASSISQRTIPQEITRIRDVLKLTTSDLATTFGVSRQAIYNWLAGEYPSEKYLLKIEDMVAAVNIFARENLTITAATLRRKIFSGQSLLESIQLGSSAESGTQKLVKILLDEYEQRKLLSNRLNDRMPNSSKMADFGVPASNESA